ncbi:MAG: BatD family protein, partial [Flavobacterium sp.]|nr:BatD family protein [Flavobacterium sp.]
EIMIKVLDGPNEVDSVSVKAENQNNSGKRQVLASNQFQYIKLKTRLIPTDKKDFFGSVLFNSLMILPFLCIPFIVLFKRKKQAIDGDVVGNRTNMNNKLAKKYLSEAQKQINNKEAFYIALEKAMHNFLKAKLHVETSEMSKDNIQEILLSKNANQTTVSDFIVLTENCELARYAPSSTASIQNDYDKAVIIISDIAKQIV